MISGSLRIYGRNERNRECVRKGRWKTGPHVHGPVCGLMHRQSSHKPQASGAKAEGRAPPGMCKALHRQPTANEQSRKEYSGAQKKVFGKSCVNLSKHPLYCRQSVYFSISSSVHRSLSSSAAIAFLFRFFPMMQSLTILSPNSSSQSSLMEGFSARI